MGDFQNIADQEQFVAFYYKTFDENRSSLQSLYRDTSMLTFETNAVQGAAAIVEKLVSLPFTKVIHKAATIDAQPASPDGRILVLVTGALQIDDQTSPMNYTQAFQLVPEASSYYVFNDVFRLIYPQ